jgi:hypothetical protein
MGGRLSDVGTEPTVTASIEVFDTKNGWKMLPYKMSEGVNLFAVIPLPVVLI